MIDSDENMETGGGSPLYIVTPIPPSTRKRKVAATLIIATLLSCVGWYIQAQNGVLLRSGWAMLGLLVPVGVFAWGVWNQTEQRILNGSWETIPDKERYNNAGITLCLMVSVCASLAWLMYSLGTLATYWWVLLPLLLVAPLIFLNKKQRWVVSEAAKAAENRRITREQLKATLREEDLYGH